jgi:hypothetical protein
MKLVTKNTTWLIGYKSNTKNEDLSNEAIISIIVIFHLLRHATNQDHAVSVIRPAL